MQRLFFASSAALALGITACGGKVIVDGFGGEGGSGGSGSTSSAFTTTTGVPTTTTGTNMTSTVVSTGVTTGPQTVSSVSTGPGTCDSVGDCQACQECTLGPGGFCEGSYQACINDKDCYGLLDCFSQCNSDGCYQMCLSAFPDAQEPYQELVFCVLCQDCYQSCGGDPGNCP